MGKQSEGTGAAAEVQATTARGMSTPPLPRPSQPRGARWTKAPGRRVTSSARGRGTGSSRGRRRDLPRPGRGVMTRPRPRPARERSTRTRRRGTCPPEKASPRPTRVRVRVPPGGVIARIATVMLGTGGGRPRLVNGAVIVRVRPARVVVVAAATRTAQVAEEKGTRAEVARALCGLRKSRSKPRRRPRAVGASVRRVSCRPGDCGEAAPRRRRSFRRGRVCDGRDALVRASAGGRCTRWIWQPRRNFTGPGRASAI